MGNCSVAYHGLTINHESDARAWHLDALCQDHGVDRNETPCQPFMILQFLACASRSNPDPLGRQRGADFIEDRRVVDGGWRLESFPVGDLAHGGPQDLA